MTEENLATDLSLKAEINLYYDLFVPANAAKNAPLLIAVHGYGAHKRYMMREARQVAPDGCVVAAVQAPHQHFRQTEKGFRVGFGWLTEYRAEESVRLHHNFLLNLIDELAGRELIDREKVFLYGFSQACALNFRFAMTYPETARAIVGVCGGIPGDLATNEIYRPPTGDVFYLYSNRDEFYPLEKYEDYAAKLRAFVPGLRADLYDAAHEITEPMRRDIADFLRQKAESL